MVELSDAIPGSVSHSTEGYSFAKLRVADLNKAPQSEIVGEGKPFQRATRERSERVCVKGACVVSVTSSARGGVVALTASITTSRSLKGEGKLNPQQLQYHIPR